MLSRLIVRERNSMRMRYIEVIQMQILIISIAVAASLLYSIMLILSGLFWCEASKSMDRSEEILRRSIERQLKIGERLFAYISKKGEGDLPRTSDKTPGSR